VVGRGEENSPNSTQGTGLLPPVVDGVDVAEQGDRSRNLAAPPVHLAQGDVTDLVAR
jgi:hypothetical protein